MSVYLDLQWLLLAFAAYGLFALAAWIWRWVQGGGRRRRAVRPFVSILVITKNKERIIEGLIRGICSFAARSDAAEFEMIVVDDRSTDQTPEILDRLTRVYANLRTVQMADLSDRAESPIEVGMFLCSGQVIILLCVEAHVQLRDLLDTVQYLLSGRARDTGERPARARVHRLDARRGFQGKEPTHLVPN